MIASTPEDAAPSALAKSKPSRCVVILSTKSSGSSALQQLLCAGDGARHVEHSRHREHETLYWTKAASILHLPQDQLPDSEVPLSAKRARRTLIELLTDNVPEFVPPHDAQALVFDGWRALCRRYAPVFVEKSPHHLHQWSNLQLMLDAAAAMPDIEFRFVGLVRNPMDMLYSVWQRWRGLPQKYQFHWLAAYRNLMRFKEQAGERLIVVRYETLVSQPSLANELVEKLGICKGSHLLAPSLDSRSLLKWQHDPMFGFRLDPTVAALARQLGYSDDELKSRTASQPRLYWWRHRIVYRALVSPRRRLRERLRGLRASLAGGTARDARRRGSGSSGASVPRADH